ncbi:F-box/kelch-repeat protein At5g51250 isoform X2 [Capsella rubella]|uniref:F-box/kelch-repeat protein At5g51250 isoform X2 n=1 Tax=Capsella rubella TaxID=81985 RepID=UPI000CD53E57|nr:F-box/kelch-repeat protein At5g51250 isoform X2 [Capsella rubella]
MSSSGKKRKTTTKEKKLWQSNPNLSLPDDLLVSIFARISRLYYPTLSLVSKSFRSLLASPDLYKARSLLGRSNETCLYVCFRFFPGPKPHWFTLCLKPDRTLTSRKNKSSGYVLATVPTPHSPPHAKSSSLVAVGSDIYNIGGSDGTLTVSILDCLSHTWREAPSLRVKLVSLSASVLDRKIYVAGRCKDGYSNSFKNSCQVFDTKTQVWDAEPIPCSETKCNFYKCESACVDGKFHLVTTQGEVVAYDSQQGRWDHVGKEVSKFIVTDSYCEIDNVLYRAGPREFKWYDTEVRGWKTLMGLVGLPRIPLLSSVILADYGGKIKIWCAVIALERHGNIWGNVEWFDHVLTVPLTYNFVKGLAVTL